MSDTLDPDETFLQIVEGVTFEEPTDVVDYTQLSDAELAKAHSFTRTKLFNMPGNELHNLNPTGEAADLRAQFAAINFEMKRRWHPTEGST